MNNTNKIKELEDKIEKLQKQKEKLLKEIEKVETIIVNGVEYEIKDHDFNKKLSEIKIPKGWRLWKVSDFEKFSLADWDKLNLKDSWFFIEYPFAFNSNNYVARFGASSVWADLYCGRDPSVADSSLGVRFAKNLRRKK